jgi:hypothetical protein
MNKRKKALGGTVFPIALQAISALMQRRNDNTVPVVAREEDSNPFMKRGGPITPAMFSEALRLYNMGKTYSKEGKTTSKSKSSDKLYEKKYGGKVKKYMSGGNVDYNTGQSMKQYNMPSHEQGGGNIDFNLNPTSKQGVAELEKKETSFQSNQSEPYIYSDTLTDPNNPAMTFAEISKKIARKYKRNTDIDKRGKELEMRNLRKRNDIEREKMGNTPVMRQGGNPITPLYDEETYLSPITDVFGSLNEKQVPGQLPASGNLNNAMAFTMGAPSRSSSSVAPLPIKSFQAISPTPKLSTNIAEPSDDPITKKPFNFNTAAIIAKGAGFLGSVIDAAQKPEVEPVFENPYGQDAISTLENLSIDLTPAINEVNLGANAAMESTRNIATNAGMLSTYANKIRSRAGRESANLRMQQEQGNNQLRSQEASAKLNLGQAERMESIRSADVNAQNRATSRGFARQALAELTQLGTAANQYQYAQDLAANNKELARKTITEGLAILQAKYPNFGLADDFMEKINDPNWSPNADDLIRFQQLFNQATESSE